MWSTVRIRGTRVPQKAIVPVGRPRPYSIITLNMRFIPKASLRASSQITASSYIPERHLWVIKSKPFALTPTWSLACKQTDCITRGILKLLVPKSLYWHSVNTKHLYDFCWLCMNVGPKSKTLGRRCINAMQMSCVCWRTFSQTLYIYSMLVQCWASVADVGLALKQHWINVSFRQLFAYTTPIYSQIMQLRVRKTNPRMARSINCELG